MRTFYFGINEGFVVDSNEERVTVVLKVNMNIFDNFCLIKYYVTSKKRQIIQSNIQNQTLRKH